MPVGFSLELDDFCSYCADFEPDVEKENYSDFNADMERTYTVVRCENRYRCKRIFNNLNKRQGVIE